MDIQNINDIAEDDTICVRIKNEDDFKILTNLLLEFNKWRT